MDYLLANEALTINVSTHGAQLQSLRRNDLPIEYLYQGYPDQWGWQSPILFPHVGSYKDNTITVADQTYESPRHGFGRHSIYHVETVAVSEITLLLMDSETTHQSYPYAFALRITYQLQADTLRVTYRITNEDKQPIHFSIGSHPAFNVPLTPDKTWSDYQITFSEKELQRYTMTADGLYDPSAVEHVTLDQLALTHDLFAGDAVVFEPKAPMTVTLTDQTHGIALDMADNPLIGIWSPYPKEADFVCLEPWQGMTDPITSTHDLANKPFSHTLAVGETFTTHYTIRPF